MGLENKQKLSPYWAKITAEAEKIIARRIHELQEKTVDPAYCLASDDRWRMTRQQWDIEGMQETLESVRKGGFWGKMAAIDAVLTAKPCMVFRRS